LWARCLRVSSSVSWRLLFFPGSLFLLSKWYNRSELGQRTALLSCGSLISNAFGALIASGILDVMDGCLGRAAWRWLFYIEGSLTIFVAICAIFILPDFPMTTSKWLSPIERRLAQRRMEEDFAGIGDEGQTEKGSAAGFVSAVNDWKVWWLAFTLASMVVSLSFNAFFPTLSATMGFNRTVTLLLCAPVRYDTLIHLGDFSSLKFLCSCIAMDFCNFGRVGCNKAF